ncbi:60S ribosomal protein L17B, variant 2 [Trifolium repens]|nr:60S ribosomal protein L17B, variant 2 [Trifolium repens]
MMLYSEIEQACSFSEKGLQGAFLSYMSSPCHIELILSEKEEAVQKEPETQLATNKKSQALRSGPSS